VTCYKQFTGSCQEQIKKIKFGGRLHYFFATNKHRWITNKTRSGVSYLFAFKIPLAHAHGSEHGAWATWKNSYQPLRNRTGIFRYSCLIRSLFVLYSFFIRVSFV